MVKSSRSKGRPMTKSSGSRAVKPAPPRESAPAPEDASSPKANYVQPTMPISAATRGELATGMTHLLGMTGLPPYVLPPKAPRATGTTMTMAPPQGPGAPRRFRNEGSRRVDARLNCALRVLLDPGARTRPTRGYSGQSRNG
jgi:hypothetical protein